MRRIYNNVFSSAAREKPAVQTVTQTTCVVPVFRAEKNETNLHTT
jgi:hypothetical protein